MTLDKNQEPVAGLKTKSAAVQFPLGSDVVSRLSRAAHSTRLKSPNSASLVLRTSIRWCFQFQKLSKTFRNHETNKSKFRVQKRLRGSCLNLSVVSETFRSSGSFPFAETWMQSRWTLAILGWLAQNSKNMRSGARFRGISSDFRFLEPP